MITKLINGWIIHFDEGDEIDADMAGLAVSHSYRILQTNWNLSKPGNIEIFLLRSWSKSLFHSASLRWKIYLFLSYPLIARKAKAIWPSAGGWAVPVGQKIVVAVKPRDLIQSADRKLGEQIFLPGRSIDEIFQTVLCHELVHGYTFHLKLPTWLHEGLAMLAMDLYLGRPIVKPETFDLIIDQSNIGRPNSNQRLNITKGQEIIKQYAFGYWVTRFLHESQPELLRTILSEKHNHAWIDKTISQSNGKSQKQFWNDIKPEMKSWFFDKTAQ